MTPEHAIQNQILRTFATRRELRLWRNNTGVARIGSRTVRFGVPGQADLTGILPDGRRLEIEVKSAVGRQTPEQAAYQAMIERYGGVYVLARSVDDVWSAIGGIIGGDASMIADIITKPLQTQQQWTSSNHNSPPNPRGSAPTP